ncbi:uncharacterized protein CDAR_87261 [Caerostris darwini]|uniref:Gustatory receptor n=1 Tax=Caerostris darwini TaxID=1538125 RepID=A0AAV4U843_9ARAC|nr:uncharacterized protein CDAR_87261 [Caerostris darwini]
MEKRTSSVCKREENRPVILSVNEPEQIPLRELNDNMEEATNPRSSFLVESPANDVFHSLSGIYAEILIVVTSASVFAEILPGSLPLFYFHDYLLLYLLGVGIMIFLVTQSIIFCRRISPKSEINADPPPISQKKAQEKNIFAINIFFKVGSAVSGSIVIITSLLEIISIFISSNYCLNTLSAVQPIIRIIFVLFHYIFLMSPKEILDTLGCFRNLALMHLFASNIVIWIRMLLWESGKDWGEIMHVKHNSSVIWDKNELNITMHSLESDINAEDINEHYPKHVVHYTSNCWWRVQKSEEVDITSVQYCLQNSTIGQIWERTDQFLFVFKTQSTTIKESSEESDFGEEAPEEKYKENYPNKTRNHVTKGQFYKSHLDVGLFFFLITKPILSYLLVPQCCSWQDLNLREHFVLKTNNGLSRDRFIFCW